MNGGVLWRHIAFRDGFEKMSPRGGDPWSGRTAHRYYVASAPQRKTWLIFIVFIHHSLVTMQRGRMCIAKTLSNLHWLSMKFRIDFKVAALTFKVLESGEPVIRIRESALLPLVERFVHRPILGNFLWFHQRPRSANELFDTRYRRSGTVYHWTFAPLHPYNRSSQD